MAEYIPRLTKDGMLNSVYWYTNTNPFYPAGYGLPNCTCYAWGRFWETYGNIPHLPTSDGGSWWRDVTGYEIGSVPQLGAVLCLERPGYAGHVAIVEQILTDGSIKTSNSGYSRDPGGYDDPNYFWVDVNQKSLNYMTESQVARGYKFQGFIYNPDSSSPTPIKKKKHRWKFYLYG